MTCNGKTFLLLILITVFVSYGLTTPSYESGVLGSIDETGSEYEVTQFEADISDKTGNPALTSFNVDIDSEEDLINPLEIRIEPQNDFLDTHGINEPRLMAFKGSNLEHSPLIKEEEEHRFIIEESGRYHIIGVVDDQNYSTYETPEGYCSQFLNPEEDFIDVNTCQSQIPELNLLTVIKGIALLSVLISLSYLLKDKIREKILIIKVNKTTEKVKNLNYIDEDILEELMEADELIINGELDKAKQKIDDIQNSISERT